MEIKVNVDDALVQETKDKCTVLVKLKTAIDKAKKSAAKFFVVEDLQLNSSTQDKLSQAQNAYDSKASELADAVVTSILGYGLSDANNENLGIDNKPESYQQVKSDTENTDTEPKTLRELAKQETDEQVKNDTPAEPAALDKAVQNDAQQDAINDAQNVTDLPEDLNDKEPETAPKQDFALQPQKESELNKLAEPIRAKRPKELLDDFGNLFITLMSQEMDKSQDKPEEQVLAELFYCLESNLAQVPIADIFKYLIRLRQESTTLTGRFIGFTGSSTFNSFSSSLVALLTKLNESKADIKAFMSCLIHNVVMYRWHKDITTVFIDCACSATPEQVGTELAWALTPTINKQPEENKVTVIDKNLRAFFAIASKGRQALTRADLSESECKKIANAVHVLFGDKAESPHAVLELVSRIAKAGKDDISKLQGEVRVKTIGRGGEDDGFIPDDNGLLMQSITDRQAEIKAQKANPHSLLRRLLDFKSDEGLRIYYQIWLRLAKNERNINYKALLDKAKTLRADADKKILVAQINSLITATGEQ